MWHVGSWKLFDILLTIKTEADAMIQRWGDGYTGRYFVGAALPRFDILAVRLEVGLYCCLGKLDVDIIVYCGVIHIV